MASEHKNKKKISACLHPGTQMKDRGFMPAVYYQGSFRWIRFCIAFENKKKEKDKSSRGAIEEK